MEPFLWWDLLHVRKRKELEFERLYLQALPSRFSFSPFLYSPPPNPPHSPPPSSPQPPLRTELHASRHRLSRRRNPYRLHRHRQRRRAREVLEEAAGRDRVREALPRALGYGAPLVGGGVGGEGEREGEAFRTLAPAREELIRARNRRDCRLVGLSRRIVFLLLLSGRVSEGVPMWLGSI